MRYSRVPASFRSTACGAFLVGGVLGICLATHASPPETITWGMPLEKAAERLQQIYARPVTYEDPARLWRGEMEVAPIGRDGKEHLRVKQHSLTMPEGLATGETVSLDAVTVTRVVEAYHQQNPDQARFRVIESRMGFHIVPAQVHDKTAQLAPSASPLDASISVPVEERTASEHLTALCKAVAAAAGTPIEAFIPYFDGYYAANGYLLPRIRTGSERPYMLFKWGATAEVARDALIDLLDGSATTLSWTLHCGLTSGQSQNGCILELPPLQVGPTRRVVFYDRCANCRHIPGS